MKATTPTIPCCFDETSKQLWPTTDRPSGPGRVEMERYDYQSTSETGPETCSCSVSRKRLEAPVDRLDRASHCIRTSDEVAGRRGIPSFKNAAGAGQSQHSQLPTVRCTTSSSQPKRGGSAKRLEFHYTCQYTAVDGLSTWLRYEFVCVFSNQCLDNRRISDEVVLKREVRSALEHERNEAVAVIDWRFSTQDARTKLQHYFYPWSIFILTRY